MTPSSRENSLAAQLPLSEAVLLILISLAPGPLHGYAILKEVEELSGSRVRLSTGTLYGALKRMLHDGWIRREPAVESEGGRERKAYVLTPHGRRILAAELERLQELLQVGDARLSYRGRHV